MGIVFRKAFRVLGLGERKGRWAMPSQGYKGRGSARAVMGSSGADGLKTWLNHAYLHRSIDVKFIFDSARLGLSSSANILQIADVAL